VRRPKVSQLTDRTEPVADRAGAVRESGSQPTPGPVDVGCDTTRDTRADAEGRHMAYDSGSIAA
jgi:hypothetical protein